MKEVKLMNSLDLYSDRAQKTFYPTPEALIEKLTDGVDWHFVSSILEPSAGKGDIARYCAAKCYARTHHYPPHDNYSWREAYENADIDCIEIDPSLRQVLSDYSFRVIHDDFLTFQTQKRYDLIVMNPPFDQGAKHLLKALEISERGGNVLCILNAETIRNPYSEERKELMKKLNEYGATIKYVHDAFKDAERKTDVEVALVRVCIPRAQVDSSIMDEMRKAPTYKMQDVPEHISTLAQYSEVEQFVNRYNYEVACGIRLIEEYNAMSKYIIEDPSSEYSHPILTLTFYGKSSYSDISVAINDYIRRTRGKYWRMIFQQPVIVNRLTGNLQQELYDSVEKLKDYEFSAYNILTLIIKMNGKVVKGVEDTIIGLFDDWTRMYWHEDSPNRHYYNGWKTNDCFRVGKKVILPFYGAYDSWDKRFRAYNVISKFRDVEKVFDFLDNGRTNWEGTLGKALQEAEATGNTRSIDTKYFTATFYKKGTAHFVFKDEDLLEKFNLFASLRKGWLPPNYGKKHYRDMTPEEKAVIDDFQGMDKYEEVIRNADYYLMDSSEMLMLSGT